MRLFTKFTQSLLASPHLNKLAILSHICKYGVRNNLYKDISECVIQHVSGNGSCYYY